MTELPPTQWFRLMAILSELYKLETVNSGLGRVKFYDKVTQGHVATLTMSSSPTYTVADVILEDECVFLHGPIAPLD